MFFLYPWPPGDGAAREWFVYWIAPVYEANEVSGEDTRAGGTVSLSSLRL